MNQPLARSVHSEPAPARPAGNLRAHLAMLLFILVISTTFPVGEAISPALDPRALTFLRFLLATFVFAGIVAARGEWRMPSPAQAARATWVGSLLAFYFVAMFEGLRYTTAINTGALFALVPAMTAAIAWLLLRQTMTRLQLACLAIAGLGALVVLYGDNIAALLNLSLGYGERMFLLGCVAFAAYSPFVRKLHRSEPLMLFTLWVLMGGAAMLFLFGLPAILSADWAKVPWTVYGGIVYLAVLPTALTFYLAKYATVRLPSGQVMAYTYLLPAFVVMEKMVIGDGTPSLTVFAGVAITALATFILQWSTRGSAKGQRLSSVAK
ncbi:EamA family transporter [Stappia sp. GBMRC 2046]|uniref:EamA family transporter n=1 Tax=Stappia sediminis TaxID=2692190 RepID=A0A7X3LTF1_9HYPH|nr:DMT family transporter [Stappia sediminis]MXN64778.1 EamA family transporter [Stappia sediminis]